MPQTKDSRPLISLGVTAYNATITLERAIHSAMGQTWRPVEVLVVDDASDDATALVLEKLSQAFPEVAVLRNDVNMGVAACRNRIIEAAKGEFVAFFDDDDQSLPTRVATQYQRITEYERSYSPDGPVVCHTARMQRYPGGATRRLGTMGEDTGRPAPHGFEVANRILRGTPLPNAYGSLATCSQMARISTYQDLGGFDPKFRRSEDSEFAVRLAKAGGHFVGVAEPVVIQEMTLTSDKRMSEERAAMLRLLEKHRDVPDHFGDYAFCRRWLEAKYAYLQNQWGRFGALTLALIVCHPMRSIRRAGLSLSHIRHNRDVRRFYGGEYDPL